MRRQAECHPDKKVHSKGMCNTCYSRWLKNTNPDYRKKQDKNKHDWIKRNRDKWNSRYKDYWHSLEKDRKLFISRRSALKNKYNMTLEQYKMLYDEQNELCAICYLPSKTRYLSVDHCHKTGKIRGLLCIHCNSALGHLKDDISLFNKAILYLEKHNEG